MIGPIYDSNALDTCQPQGMFSNFFSDDREETKSFATSLYCPHEFQLANRDMMLTTRIAWASLTNIGLASIRFGANVSVDPGKLRSFYLVQSVVSGSVDVISGNQRCLSTPGLATAISPDQETRMQWDRHASFLSIKIDKQALENQLEELIGEAITEPLVFDLKFNLQDEKSKPWQSAVEALYSQLRYSDWHSSNSDTSKLFERWLISTLLNTQRHNYSSRMNNNLLPGAPKSLRKAVHFIEQNFTTSIDNKTIAQACGLSERKLNSIFQQFMGMTAKQYQLDIRMRHVNSALKDGHHDTSVTAIFENAGVQHHGRFSSCYKAKFGELPSDTLFNARQQTPLLIV